MTKVLADHLNHEVFCAGYKCVGAAICQNVCVLTRPVHAFTRLLLKSVADLEGAQQPPPKKKKQQPALRAASRGHFIKRFVSVFH